MSDESGSEIAEPTSDDAVRAQALQDHEDAVARSAEEGGTDQQVTPEAPQFSDDTTADGTVSSPESETGGFIVAPPDADVTPEGAVTGSGDGTDQSGEPE